MSFRLAMAVRMGRFSLELELEGGDGPCLLVGPNGSGKSTLLRLVAGVRTPDRGTLTVGERVIVESDRGISLAPEDRAVGYLPQGFALFPHLRVLDNVAFGPRSRGRTRDDANAAAFEMLDRLGCRAMAERMPETLSGGERQRIALARALMIEPAILLLDEPMAAIDAASRKVMRTFLRDHLVALARPSIIVIHDVRDLLAFDAPIHVLEEGRIVQRGSADALRRAPATEFVAELLASA